ncbi:MAG TPA: helix-turn-helix domain-containing protein [Pseudonocardiaceae bacterium]|jgi:AcrR family transcriptional regulator|nr:helix-turn-helix domain-containing protein [Pseudonocardiaceae bacterium]
MSNGRVNQKLRTRNEILRAAVDLIRTGRDVTMPEIAKAALVSEATAYRHFPDLATLLAEAMAGQMPAKALAGLESTDPVERTAIATERLLRHVLTYQGSVRAMIAATITKPATARTRPGLRFGLIDEALDPLTDTLAPEALAQLKNDLAIVVSAEALFNLTDLCGLTPEAAIASAVHTATTLTRAALSS